MFHDILGWERALPYLGTAFAVGYLIGSIPFGVLVARFLKLGDLRKIGSGNIGATNVLRTGNKGAALLTLLLDAAKGAVAVLIFLQWGPLAPQCAALGAFFGHLLPVWLMFRGGKGVATFLGIWLALAWPVGLLNLATWLVAAVLTRFSSAGALAAAAICPLWLIAFGRWGEVLLAIVLGVFVWLRHHANIRRILQNEEPKIGAGRKD